MPRKYKKVNEEDKGRTEDEPAVHGTRCPKFESTQGNIEVWLIQFNSFLELAKIENSITKKHVLINYLGFSISEKGIQTREDKIDAVIKISRPTDLKKLEAFLGMVTYYSKFIQNFSELCHPLNNLRKKNVDWEWSDECERSFNLLKLALRTAPVLTHYDPELPLVLAADASSVGVGASLLHRYADGTEKPIAFASKTLTQSEKGYSQIEREALAIIYAVKKFRMYLLGRKFILQTDHRPLLTIFGSKKGVPVITSARLQRWALFLTNYSFSVEFVPTAHFGKADGLSRLPGSGDGEFDVSEQKYQNLIIAAVQDEMFSRVPVSAEDIAKETALDPVLSKVTKYIRDGWPRACTEKEISPYFRVRDTLSLHRECILHGIRVVIPLKYQPYVLGTLHETHAGMIRMKINARDKVWWPGLEKDIEERAHKCQSCNTFARNEPHTTDLSPWPRETHPWARVHLDFAGPFYGKMFLLVVDAYSRWLEVITMGNITTRSTTKALQQLWYRYGAPQVIVTDNATTFTSSEFKMFCAEWGSTHITTPAYHPQSNGQVEKYVDTVKRTLTKLMHSNPRDDFNELVQKFLFGYRSSPHSVTRTSPAEFFLGRQLRTKLDILKPEERGEGREENSKIIRKTFVPGQVVFTRNYRPGKELWSEGKITKRLGRNTWLLEVDGVQQKRHTHQIRSASPRARPDGGDDR